MKLCFVFALKWNSSTSLFEKQTNWFAESTGLEAPTGTNGLSYWDIPDDGAGGFSAPQQNKLGDDSDVPLRRAVGTHIQSPVLRNGSLWVCMHVGFDSTGGYAGSADRSGVVWCKFQVNGSSNPPNLIHTSPSPTFGKIWDNSSTPYWYYYPSLMVNKTNDVVLGFSGSKADEYVGCFFWGQRGDDGTALTRPVLVQAGRDYFPFGDGTTGGRWGDYTATVLDPLDSLTFCTFQEYVEANGFWDLPDSYWGTWILTIKKGP